HMDEIQVYLDSRKNRVSPNYLRDTGTVLRAWRRVSDTIESETIDSIQNWLNALSVKPGTIAAYAFVLRQFFDWTVKTGLRTTNPVTSVQLPKTRKPFRKNFVSAATVRTLINECGDRE